MKTNERLSVNTMEQPTDIQQYEEQVPVSKSEAGAAYARVKRLVDVVFSLFATIILLIPGAVICLLVSIESPGKPIYAQVRVGKDGKLIKVLKIRTMYADADKHAEKYLSEEQLRQWKTEFKVENDPRITKLGKFLRKTSIDEIPQFLNVLSGVMSIVGPRPITPKETVFFGKDKERFLSVKPGITGWWQVTERNNATYENGKRQEIEMYYVNHASLMLDLRIAFATFGTILHKTGK